MTTRSIHADSEKWLRPVLEEWCDVVLDYCRALKWQDVPWWYGERAAVGLFAAALTRAGWVVLEEYSTEKIGHPKRRLRLRGRQDLLAVKGSRTFVAEAKNDWTRVPRKTHRLIGHLDSLLDLAACDAAAKDAYGFKQAAILFSSPKIRRSDDAAIATREWIEAIQSLKGCASACVLPARTKRFPEGTETDDDEAGWSKFIFPGTAVIIRQC